MMAGEPRPALLHPVVTDPSLAALAYLNETGRRFPDAISFTAGAPHDDVITRFDPAPHLRRFAAHLRHTRGLSAAGVASALYQYGPSAGLINDLIADALRIDEGIDVGADSVVVTVGCQEALLLVLRTLCRSDDSVVAVVDPCYVGALGAARVLDLEVVGFDEVDGGLDLAGLRAACAAARARGKRVRAVYVAPDFANPTGTRLDLDTRRQLLDLAVAEDVFLLEDSTYGFTAHDRPGPPSLKALDTAGRVIRLGTFAKTIVPGVRVGYVVADQPVCVATGPVRPLAAVIAAVKGMVTLNTSPICQAIVGGMLLAHGGSLAALVHDRAVLYRRNLDLLLAALRRYVRPVAGPGVRWNEPEGGFFVRMRLPVPVDDALLAECARRFGVVWTPMRAFHVGHGGDHDLRLSCSHLSEAEIDEGVRRLAGFIATLAD